MPHIFPDFNWTMSLYRPALELPETRQFRPAFVDCGDGTKKIDPMLACRVVVIKWIAQYTHQTRSSQSGPTGTNFKQQPARWLFRHFRVIFASFSVLAHLFYGQTLGILTAKERLSIYLCIF